KHEEHEGLRRRRRITAESQRTQSTQTDGARTSVGMEPLFLTPLRPLRLCGDSSAALWPFVPFVGSPVARRDQNDSDTVAASLNRDSICSPLSSCTIGKLGATVIATFSVTRTRRPGVR